MAARYNSSTTALLLGAVAALLVLNWKISGMELDTSPLPDEVAGPTSAAPVAEHVEIRPLGPLTAYRETLTRPLFHPSRRPLVAPAPSAEAPAEPPAEIAAAEPSRMKLLGLIRTGARAQRALIRLEGQPYGTWVDVGGEIEGWRLSSIEPNKVLIEKNGGREELLLYSQGQ